MINRFELTTDHFKASDEMNEAYNRLARELIAVDELIETLTPIMTDDVIDILSRGYNEASELVGQLMSPHVSDHDFADAQAKIDEIIGRLNHIITEAIERGARPSGE